MNKVLNEIKELVTKNINKFLPEVKPSELEENGMIYYMNGQNGTEFEYYVNGHLPSFMVFYNDEKNLGALKLLIYNNGEILIYIYGDKGNKLIKEISTSIEASSDEIFKLAIILKNVADNNKRWDASIDKINADLKITNDMITEFKNTQKYMEPIIDRKNFLNKIGYVSRKILEDGWKVGYMYREESLNEEDSGWSFMAGDEDEKYIDDSKNIVLIRLNELSQLDPDILSYIESPVGTALIRISSNEFEIDKHDKEIYMDKRYN